MMSCMRLRFCKAKVSAKIRLWLLYGLQAVARVTSLVAELMKWAIAGVRAGGGFQLLFRGAMESIKEVNCDVGSNGVTEPPTLLSVWI